MLRRDVGANNGNGNGNAFRLNEGLEAMDMLKMGRPGEVQEESEISKIWTAKFQQVRLVALDPV